MTDDLLPYYNSEIAYLREMAQRFAERHPQVAGQLRLSGDASDDPHVTRLLEGVAFLNARTARKLDDDFPELVDSLLEVLYPHYLAPVPAFTNVQFRLKPGVASPQLIPTDTELDSEPVRGEACRFRTRYPVTLWPIQVASAALTTHPVVAPQNPRASEASSALRLSLATTVPDLTFSTLSPDRLRFFLRGTASQVHALYELILNNTVSVALSGSAGGAAMAILPAASIQPVGFSPEESLLPRAPQAQPGYQLLTEFFCYPDKFLYFDLVLGPELAGFGPELHAFLYFNKSFERLERSVTAETFTLGCTPVVNLFRQRAEPILVSHNRLEHRVIPDARRQRALEVYKVLSASAADGEGRMKTVHPFFSGHGPFADAGACYWSALRRPTEGQDGASDVFVSFTGLDPAFARTDWLVSLETLCFNGDLPAELPYGVGHPVLTPVQGIGTVSTVTCLAPLTRTQRFAAGSRHHWHLISHLALNHLSLVGDKGLEALKEILGLYDMRGSDEALHLIQGLTRLTAQRGLARAPTRPGDPPWGDAICRGIDITLEFDPSFFSGTGPFLMAMVLNEFFALHASLNSFTRLTAVLKGQSGVLRTWPARAGNVPLL